MKARIYRMLHGKIEAYFVAELATEATVNNVLDVISQAKKNFKMWGKMFIVVTEDKKTFLVTKLDKWYSYELKGPEKDGVLVEQD